MSSVQASRSRADGVRMRKAHDVDVTCDVSSVHVRQTRPASTELGGSALRSRVAQPVMTDCPTYFSALGIKVEELSGTSWRVCTTFYTETEARIY